MAPITKREILLITTQIFFLLGLQIYNVEWSLTKKSVTSSTSTTTARTRSSSLRSNNSNDESSSSLQKETSDNINDEDLLLSVPFYIYEELNWLEEGFIGNQTFLEVSQAAQNPKHTDDVRFLLSALRHPLRVDDPARAKLFVVPFLASLVSIRVVYKATTIPPCVRATAVHGDEDDGRQEEMVCGGDALHALVDQFLQNSEWFQRNGGNDHLLTTTHFSFNHPMANGHKKYKNMMKCHVIRFGEAPKYNHPDRLDFAKMYVGTPCAVAEEKTHDFAMIATMKGGKKFRNRRDICAWIGENNGSSTNNHKNYSMSVCGAGQQCPALAEARMGFHVRGDSFGANRLFDTMLSGSVPVFTVEKQYNIVPDWYDWGQLSYFANVSDRTSFLNALDGILENRDSVDTKLNTVLENRKLFDWTTLVPFDTYMYMLQAQLWPESRVNSSRFSALILPPPIVLKAQQSEASLTTLASTDNQSSSLDAVAARDVSTTLEEEVERTDAFLAERQKLPPIKKIPTDPFRVLCTTTGYRLALGSFKIRCLDFQMYVQKYFANVIIDAVPPKQATGTYNATVVVKNLVKFQPNYGPVFVDVVDSPWLIVPKHVPTQYQVLAQNQLMADNYRNHKAHVVTHWFNSFFADDRDEPIGPMPEIRELQQTETLLAATVWESTTGCPENNGDVDNLDYQCIRHSFTIADWYHLYEHRNPNQVNDRVQTILKRPDLGSGFLYRALFRKFHVLVVFPKDGFKLKFHNVQRVVSQMRSGVPVLVDCTGPNHQAFCDQYDKYPCVFHGAETLWAMLEKMKSVELRQQCQQQGIEISSK